MSDYDAETTVRELRLARAEIKRLRQALNYILNPVDVWRAEAERNGTKLDGHTAIMLMDDPNFLRSIARKTLDRR